MLLSRHQTSDVIYSILSTVGSNDRRMSALLTEILTGGTSPIILTPLARMIFQDISNQIRCGNAIQKYEKNLM